MSRLFRLCAVLTLLPILAAGCGGGGGGGGSSLLPNDRTAEVAVFATDSFRDDYDQVWVSVHKVELLEPAGAAETVFSDDAGKVLDLRSLRDASGERFELLGEGRVRPATYSDVRVTIGDLLNVVPRGGAAAQPLQVAAEIPRDAQGHPIIQFPLQAPRNLSGPGGTVVVDFDLANFVIAAGRLRPALKEAISQLLPNPERHERNHFGGVITGLTTSTAGSAFQLQLANGLLLPVAVTSEAVIFNADGSPNAELSEGQRVKIEGAFDLGSRRFGASEIRIEPRGDGGDRRALVVGAPLRASPDSGAFVLRIVRVEGFLPRTREITVQTGERTVLHDSSGLVITRAEFFANILESDLVKAAGNYDPEANTFAAHHARLHRSRHEPRQVRAVGKPIEIQPGEQRFWLNPIYEFEGFRPEARAVRVQVTANTRLVLANGETVAAPRFFEHLALAGRVVVEGIFTRENNTITAAFVRIREGQEPPREVSAVGIPVEIDREHRRFAIRPVEEHHGFDVRDGLVHVLTTERTIFRARDGETITAAAFFEALRGAARVRVEGHFDRATNTITASAAVIVGDRVFAAAVGHPVEVNADRRSFLIYPLIEWTGFTPHERRVRVVTTAETVFKNGEGRVISAADFFHLLREARAVRVEGRHDAGANVFTAAQAQIRPA